MRTRKQRVRQDKEYRSKGRYGLVNPCYCCGKSAGVDPKGHPLTDTLGWDDHAICVCDRCYKVIHKFTKVEQFFEYKKQFGNAAELAWEKVSKQRGD